MTRVVLAGMCLALVSVSAMEQPSSSTAALIARAKSLEVDTPYAAPPGEAAQHHAAGFAKIMCSAVFVTGLDPAFAAENVGYFTAPYEVRQMLGRPIIDRVSKEVHVMMPNGVRRTARYLGKLGCVTLPLGTLPAGRGGASAFANASADKSAPPASWSAQPGALGFTAIEIKSTLPDPETQPWPMGDRLSKDPPPPGINVAKVQEAVDAAFDPPGGMTAAFVVTWRGRILGERYGDGITMHTPLESWSMGKSLTATLLGVLIKQGVYRLNQPAPIPEWQQEPNDPRAKITIADILHMSSGLRARAPQDPDYDSNGPYPDHLYYYTGDNAFRWAATRPQQWPPNTVGRYRNTDPVLINYLIRLALEKRNEEYHSFPQRALFDKIGVRTMVMDVDSAGNFLTQGYELASGRDWARLGNLYLQNGVWNGQRILPEGYAEFVSTLAPAWKADNRPVYGGFFWINGEGTFPVPRDAYYMTGVGGQTTLIVPSHDLVAVRLGHYKGVVEGGKSFRRALALLMEAVPARASQPRREH